MTILIINETRRKKKEIGNAITRKRSVEDTRPIYGVGVSESTQYFLWQPEVFMTERVLKNHTLTGITSLEHCEILSNIWISVIFVWKKRQLNSKCDI